jgi:hypothetical protein
MHRSNSQPYSITLVGAPLTIPTSFWLGGIVWTGKHRMLQPRLAPAT